MQDTRRREFSLLFAEAVSSYLSTPTGQEHLACYVSMRTEAQRNLDDILAKRERGEDVTDDILLRLLPYTDTPANRESGAWVHVAPAITGSLRDWYERARRTKREEWPQVAAAILDLVVRCVEHPEELAAACEAFSALPYSKGFQAGMLSPILNALNPDAFRIVNNKTRAVYNYFAGTRHEQPLVGYPAANETARQLCEEVAEEVGRHPLPDGSRPDDVLDLFCHWLVSVRKYEFEKRFTHLTEAQVEAMLEKVRAAFPDWLGVDDPRFVYHEVAYKRATIEKAQELLSEAELRRLLAADEYDEVVACLETVGKATNLLFLARPRTGDLSILYQESLDRPSFCQAMVDLLYGAGPSEERLAAYAQYVESQGLPNKWTFPTYYLFLCHPKSEMFVKPYTIRWLFELAAKVELWDWKPNRDTYASLKGIAKDLLTALEPYGAIDMVDVQSVIWAGYGYKDMAVGDTWSRSRGLREREQPEMSEPFSVVFASREQATRTFRLLRQALERLGVVSAADRRFVVTLRREARETWRLRLMFGHWPVLGFRGAGGTLTEVETILLDDAGRGMEGQETFAFAVREGEPQVRLYALAPDDIGEGDSELLGHAMQALDYVRGRLGHWRQSNFSSHSDGRIAEAIFDDQALTTLLTEGLEMADAPALAEPFASLFPDWDSAVWGLSLLREAVQRLGVEGPGDERFVITLRQYRGGSALRLLFGRWIVLGYYAPRGEEREVGFTLLEELGGAYTEYQDARFAPVLNGPQANYYMFPVDEFEGMEIEAVDAYMATLDAVRGMFGHWMRSHYRGRGQHQHDIATALFAPDGIPALLAKGLGPVVPPADGYFDEETFALLAGLHETPTKEYYQTHKEAFVGLLEKPFAELLAAVVAQLPEAMTEVLETEKGVTARILKNDYGRGGAWPFYWGAFYPKGGKRISDAQLYVSAGREGLCFGSYIGEYGEEPRRRFERNVQANREALLNILAPDLDALELTYGEDEAPLRGAAEWLRRPQTSPRTHVTLSVDEVATLTRAELGEAIGVAFRTLFPLVLLAASDSPMPAIRRYLDIEDEDATVVQPLYSLDQCAEDTGIHADTMRDWLRGLERKGQAILYGPPGTGKTFMARHLARHLVGGGDGFVETVQFHPAYAYEDFVQGIRPQMRDDGSLHYPVVRGQLLEFCERAAERQGLCVLIIDEINRAELSRVFGELMYLLEYRGESVRLAADGRRFSIPANVRIIGTMNTADRSIALVDHALRRRFAFIALYPEYEVLTQFHVRHATGFPTERLIQVLRRLNAEIDDANYHVGITFFLHQDLASSLPSIWRMEIEPYLEEHFFDRPERVSDYRWDKLEAQLGSGA